MKANRQRKIVQLLKQQPVTSQNQLVKLLRSAGYDATQATVSRDLEELGAIKVRRQGKVVYAAGDELGQSPGRESLRKMFLESVLDLRVGGQLLVIKTPPGHAGMVAGGLDRSGTDGLQGTIAGDDTVLVILAPGVVPTKIERKLRTLIEAIPEIRSAHQTGGAA